LNGVRAERDRRTSISSRQKVTLYEEDRKKREALEQKVATLEKLVTQQQEQIKKLSHFHKEKLNEEIIRQLQLKYKFFRKNFYAH